MTECYGLQLLGDLIKGTLQEEGYKVTDITHATAVKSIAIRGMGDQEYTATIILKQRPRPTTLVYTDLLKAGEK